MNADDLAALTLAELDPTSAILDYFRQQRLFTVPIEWARLNIGKLERAAQRAEHGEWHNRWERSQARQCRCMLALYDAYSRIIAVYETDQDEQTRLAAILAAGFLKHRKSRDNRFTSWGVTHHVHFNQASRHAGCIYFAPYHWTFP